MAEITDCIVCLVGLRSSVVTTGRSYFFANKIQQNSLVFQIAVVTISHGVYAKPVSNVVILSFIVCDHVGN